MQAPKYKLFLLLGFLVYSPLSAEVIQLTHGDGENYGSTSPRFSNDGKKIAYQSSKNGTTYRIWTMDIDGNNKREITQLAWDASPAWSPQGDIIAFQSYGEEFRNRNFSIWMVNVKNGKTWQFIKSSKHGDQRPCWSPDGNSIVWSHGTQLWISPHSNPEKARPLTRTPAKAWEYCGGWSPDGKWIAYIAADTHDYSNGIPYKMWLIRPNGQDQSMLFDGISAYRLKWSKNGEWIYFSTDDSFRRLTIESGVQEKLFDWNNTANDFDISSDERWFVYDDNGDHWLGNIFLKPFSGEPQEVRHLNE